MDLALARLGSGVECSWNSSSHLRYLVSSSSSSRLQCMSRIHASSIPKLNGCRVDEQLSKMSLSSLSSEQQQQQQQQLCSVIPLVALAIVATGKSSSRGSRNDSSRGHKTGSVSSSVHKTGELIEGDLVYRQSFVIRSYEVGFDRLASIETLTNLFQETALNHVGMSDFVGDGLGTTHAMMRHCLIWVVTRMHIQVQRYPVWGDVVEIDSWINGCGKNFIRRDFHVRDHATGETLCTATSTWAMMNKSTRRLSKIPVDVHEEISPYYLNRHIMDDEIGQKIVKLDDDSATYIQKSLVPKLHDMDMNQHVNNVKYIGWVLESIPQALLVAHELTSMTLEYRRECAASDVVTSLTSPSSCSKHEVVQAGDLQQLKPPDIERPLITSRKSLMYTHLLKMQSDGSEILRGRTVWRLKQRFCSSDSIRSSNSGSSRCSSSPSS